MGADREEFAVSSPSSPSLASAGVPFPANGAQIGGTNERVGGIGKGVGYWDLGATEIAKRLKVGRASVYRVLAS